MSLRDLDRFYHNICDLDGDLKSCANLVGAYSNFLKSPGSGEDVLCQMTSYIEVPVDLE